MNQKDQSVSSPPFEYRLHTIQLSEAHGYITMTVVDTKSLEVQSTWTLHRAEAKKLGARILAMAEGEETRTMVEGVFPGGPPDPADLMQRPDLQPPQPPDDHET